MNKIDHENKYSVYQSASKLLAFIYINDLYINNINDALPCYNKKKCSDTATYINIMARASNIIRIT